jgi:excinuclease UvrABC helicase subunit UvrB
VYGGYINKDRSVNRNMEKEKLKSTTVRFTKEDLHIIDMLQRRLGLGMVQVIRVAIRRLAQLEKVVLSLPKPDDR